MTRSLVSTAYRGQIARLQGGPHCQAHHRCPAHHHRPVLASGSASELALGVASELASGLALGSALASGVALDSHNTTGEPTYSDRTNSYRPAQSQTHPLSDSAHSRPRLPHRS